VCSIGDEPGTSSRWPQGGPRHRPQGRVWQCRKWRCAGHRDGVGAVTMPATGFGVTVTLPAHVTDRRAGPLRAAPGMNNPALISPAGRRRADTSLGRMPLWPATAAPQGGASGGQRDAGSPARRKSLLKAA
jgi:hypothetical protein